MHMHQRGMYTDTPSQLLQTTRIVCRSVLSIVCQSGQELSTDVCSRSPAVASTHVLHNALRGMAGCNVRAAGQLDISGLLENH